MLSIGFGFVTEGTFPPQKAEELGDWNIPMLSIGVDPLAVYSFLCAMSLILPFWCLILAIRMRYEVDLIVREHINELRKQLCNVLKKKQIQDPDEACDADEQLHHQGGTTQEVSSPLIRDIRVARKIDWLCPARVTKTFRGALHRCPTRVRSKVADLEVVADKAAAHVGPYSIDNEPLAIEQAQILKWAGMDLLQRMVSYSFYLKCSHILLWLGMLAAVFTCTILLGVYMMENFPNTPMMWRAYTYPVGINGILGAAFALWMWLPGSNRNALRSVSSWSMDAPGGTDRVKRESSSKLTLDGMIKSSSSNLGHQQRVCASFQIPTLCEPLLPGFPSRSSRHFELRVREAVASNGSYRRITFSPCKTPRFEDIRARICEKFADPSGSNASPKRLELLVRLCDSLEISDDEDAGVLVSGDRLEATLSPKQV